MGSAEEAARNTTASSDDAVPIHPVAQGGGTVYTKSALAPGKSTIIATDLDHTLWVPGESCPAPNIEALEELRRRAVAVVPITGRSLIAAKRGVERFGLGSSLKLFPGVYSDGAVIFGKDENERLLLAALTMNQVASVREFAMNADPHSVNAYCFQDGQYVESLSRFAAITGLRHLQEWDESLDEFAPDQPKPWDSEIGCLNVIVHSLLLSSDTAAADEFRRALHDTCEVLQFPAFEFVMIKPKNIDKATGLRRLAAHYGWADTDIFVLGDGSNDIEMLQEFPVTMAMCDGVADAIAVSKDVSRYGASEGGWADAVLRYTSDVTKNKPPT